MKPQVVHEAEIHRQHVRLRIPIAVEIDGTRYSVDDWSMGGFGVAINREQTAGLTGMTIVGRALALHIMDCRKHRCCRSRRPGLKRSRTRSPGEFLAWEKR